MTWDWRADADCLEEDPEIWFQDTGMALFICATCPVRTPCLQFALDDRADYGVWGGHTPEQRERIRRNSKRRRVGAA